MLLLIAEHCSAMYKYHMTGLFEYRKLSRDGTVPLR